MDAEQRRTDDIEPIKIRVRQVFCGSGEMTRVESVYCPARERSISLDACATCGHGQGVYSGPGDASVFCDHSKARDLPLRQVLHGRAVQRDTTPVAELMTTHVLCVREDLGIDALTNLLIERKISGVPVVDARGAPIGIISKTDLLQHRYEGEDLLAVDQTLEPGYHADTPVRVTVGELMTPVPIAFGEDTPISQVAAAMAAERIHRLPIVGEDGTVVGIVSSLDVVGWYAQREGYKPGSRRRSPSD